MSDHIVIATRGIPGCGKSTWARHYIEVARAMGIEAKRISKDDLRAMMDDSFWSPQNESHIMNIRLRILEYLMQAQVERIIFDDTNFGRNLNILSSAVQNYNANLCVSSKDDLTYTFEVHDFPTPLDACLIRNSHREGIAKVPEEVVRKFQEQYEQEPVSKLLEQGHTVYSHPHGASVLGVKVGP